MALAEYTIVKDPVDGRPRKTEYHASETPGVEYELVEKEYRDGRWHAVGTEQVAELRLTASVGDDLGAEVLLTEEPSPGVDEFQHEPDCSQRFARSWWWREQFG